MEAKLSKAETKRMHKMLGEWMERPKNWPFVERTIIRPSVQKACKKAYRKAFEKGRRQKYVEILLELLQENGIKLTESQRKRLHGLPYEELPLAAVALDAKSASDFARKAGLHHSQYKQ